MALPLEKNPPPVYPQDILSTECNETVWWVAHTKSRREKTLAGFLASNRIGYYLPLLKRRQPSHRRDRFSLIPLFPGYIFFKGRKEDRYLAYSSNQIARVIEVTNQETLVDEMKKTSQLLASGEPVYPYDFLAEGQKVEVKHGPMKGFEGIIVHKKGNYRLVLNITTISQSIAVNVDSDMVEAV